jgi:hypothetical protein
MFLFGFISSLAQLAWEKVFDVVVYFQQQKTARPLRPSAPLGDQPDQPNQRRGNSLGQSRGERAKGRRADDLGCSLIGFLNSAVKPLGVV